MCHSKCTQKNTTWRIPFALQLRKKWAKICGAGPRNLEEVPKSVTHPTVVDTDRRAYKQEDAL
ncbi:Uncharacterized protein APZ42_012451 [Daphnia magna]|uniref:Uncharacterized protein n=1 Tax=Daphnia magna TaxID=35525 RepID=A0A162RTB3_9CRUS|nr:Uncharacterized protein APZ42_012451 [Daphnia magna]